jgi:hypothetical protein
VLRRGCLAQSPTFEENEELLCVICLVNDRDTTVLPCRHMCMCQDCAQVRSMRVFVYWVSL